MLRKGFGPPVAGESVPSTPRAPDGQMGGSFNQRLPTKRADQFFQRMGATLAEAEALNKQCRVAAEHAAARRQPEFPDVNRFHESILSAKAVSEFAAQIGHGASSDHAPYFIGHLSVPKPTVQLPANVDQPHAFDLAPTSLASHKPENDDLAPERPLSDCETEREMSPPRRLSSGSKNLPARQASWGASKHTAENRAMSPPRRRSSGPKPQPARQASWGASKHTAENRPSSQVGIGSEMGSIFGGGMADDVASGEKSASLSDNDEFSLSSVNETDESSSPPKAPIMRFKGIIHFSSCFKPSRNEFTSRVDTRRAQLNIKETDSALLIDPVVGWINCVFTMDLKLELEVEVGFPVVMLTILDAIYPNKVSWPQVDWKFQYRVAITKNYALLNKVWAEVNMDKARGFRCVDTNYRLNNMRSGTTQDKLAFLRLMKRWFDTRIRHTAPYDPCARRKQIETSCRKMGLNVEFPRWMLLEKDAPGAAADPVNAASAQMPEFSRLAWFLSSPEEQTM